MENNKTTVGISGDEVKLISENLKGAETLSAFVHVAINELIDKRRQEKGLFLNGKEAQQ